MRVFAIAVILLLAMLAGCVTVEDKNGTGDDGAHQEPEPEPEDGTDELTGGDPEEDTAYRESLGVPAGAAWKKMDHHFRVPIKLSSTAQVGETYRLTIDVGAALQEVGLRWLHPGTPLAELDPDATSIVLHQVSSAGMVQRTVPVESRAAGTHAIELAFEHVGGNYILYFDDERNNADGEMHALFPDAADIKGFRGKAQWQGDNLWGLVYSSGEINHWPGKTVIMYAYIENDNRNTDRQPVKLPFTLVPRAPADWDDVTVDPEEGEVQDRKRVSIRGTSPEGSTGSDTVHLDVVSDGQAVTATFLVRYHST